MNNIPKTSTFVRIQDAPLFAPAPPSAAARVLARWPYLLCVIVPTLLAAFYNMFLASNRYVAEAQFVVRTPGGTALSEIAGLFQGSSSIRATDEAYIVNAFIMSHEAAEALKDRADLLAVLRKGCGDPLWCYPGYFRRHTIEGLTRFLQGLISVDFNSTSGVSTLKVQAFTPDDASRLAEFLLNEAEDLLNRLNVRAQRDAVRLAEDEVEASRARADKTLADLAGFRERAGFLDPTAYGKSVTETMTRLALEAAMARATILELQQTSPLSPQINSLKTKATALDAQIEAERGRLVGADTSLSSRISEYEALSLEKEFAERRFSSALASAEIARLDANRQRVFLERISSPSPPEKAEYPYRLLMTLTAFALLHIIYSVLKRIGSNALQHALG